MKKTLHKLMMVLAMSGMFTGAFAQSMPAAITIEPEGATAFDQIKLTFNAKLACTPSGKVNLLGLAQVAMHSAIKKLGTTWDSWGAPGVDYNATPGGGYTTKLTNNGDDTYSITFVPADYYKVTADDGIFIGISCVFNNGNGWDAEGKDQGDGACKDFQVPLKYVSSDPVGNFNLNMKKIAEAGDFIGGVDKAYLVIDGLGVYDMLDLDAEFNSDSIYFVKVETGLVKDSTYAYHYRINSGVNETVTRSFKALGGPNTFNDWWNNDPIAIPCKVEFKLDMTYPIANALFNPASEFIDVAGSFNGWGPPAGQYQLVVTADPNVYTISVDLTAGTKYEFKFRFNANWDTSEFPPGTGPNRELTPVAGNQVVSLAYNTRLSFTVDMTKAVTAGTFIAATDFVDVAGSMNGWAGSAHMAGLGGNIYEIKIDNVKPADALEYKFRINANWDTSEYPPASTLPNRKYTVTYGYQIVHHFYDVPTSVQSDVLNSISFFPNPVRDKLVILNSESVDRIVITSILGQDVKTVKTPGAHVEISTSDLQSGVYFLNFVSLDGTRRTEKIIIK
ncbi:MAG: T9SS type A sorting domain-containing protein [Bacteroidia bacterium]|nr:T9SS type A sorting domain-containing protein [Bacteroidia bacterium]